MMRCITHRRCNLLFGSIACFIRGDAVCRGCLAKSPTQKIGGMPCFSFGNDGELSLSYFQKIFQGCKLIHGSLHKPFSCSRSISMQHHSAHSSIIGCHFYPDGYAHAIYLWQCRDLCTITSQEPADLKHEVGCSKAAWETLASQMKDLKDGLAKGKALEALKGLVDQLEPCAEPTDLRLGLACLRLAQSLADAGEEPSMYLRYAQRALKGLETLQGSWEHALCLFVLGSVYVKLEKFDSAASQLEQCGLVLQQMKGTIRDDRYNNFVLSVHHILGQLENIRGNFCESLVHYEHAIRIGKKVFKARSPKLPTMYYQAGTVCRNVADSKVAMCFAQKALEGFMTCYGPSSLQVGKVRALMSGIHCDLQKYEDALLDYNEAKPILEYLKETEEVARMNLDIAKLLSSQNKNEAALPLLQEVIKSTEVTSQLHVNALMCAAFASSELKLEVAADYCQKTVDALDHQETSRNTVYNLVHLALLAEKRAEFDHAAVLLQKVMKMVDECLPNSVLVEQKMLQQLRDKAGMLLLRAGKVKKAIPYFQRCLKDAESGNGVQLLSAHFMLGTAYSLVNQNLEASKHFKACNATANEWLHLYLIYYYYKFAIKNRSIDNMGALENMGICMLWFFV